MKRTWIQTFSGQKFYPLEPRPEDVEIVDIAHALSNICRYTGHCREFYSVAQHSVLCSYQASPEIALDVLLHDAAEAYTGDWATPIKRMVEFPAGWSMEHIEHQIMVAIRLALKLPHLRPSVDRAVKVIDKRMLATEVRQLMTPVHADWVEWLDGIEPYPLVIQCWKPVTAQYKFLRRYRELRAA